MKKISLLILILFQINLYSDIKTEIKVRLFSSYYSDNTIVSPVDGTYYLLSENNDGSIIDTIAVIDADNERRSSLNITNKKGFLLVNQNKKYLGRHRQLFLKAKDERSTFLIRYADLKERLYDGSLHVYNRKSNIQLINTVSLDSYVAGVVESEVGSNGNKEFYKVQAILARTYALKNYNKFIKNGYNLTDDVRSQVYLSKAYFVKRKMIHEAVLETKNLVVVDSNHKLIDAAFHANSGGQTLNSGMVWMRNLPYLTGIEDPYSVETAKDSLDWSRKISKEKYLNYFYTQAPNYEGEKEFTEAILSFKQSDRKESFKYKKANIRLIDVREEFDLRSTFFNVESTENYVILNGRGHGHGVGLSQIGAYNMAKGGFSYLEIIQYYYANVNVVDYSKVKK